MTTSVRYGERQHFVSFDFLRVLASLMIVLFHAHSIALKDSISHGQIFFEAPVWWYSCIDLFFVLSGFLMIHMSHNLFGSLQGIKLFIIRRLCRTPPLYWIYTSLVAGVFILVPSLSPFGQLDFRTFLSSIFFYPDIKGPIMVIGWTLNYEIFFYCIFGISLALPYSSGWKLAVLSLIGAVSLGRILGVTSHPWINWTDPLMLDFAIGMLIAVVYHKGVAFSNLGAGIILFLGVFLILSYRHLENIDLLRISTMGAGIGCILAASIMRTVPISFGRYGSFINKLSQQTYTMYLCHSLILKSLSLIYFHLTHGVWANCFFILLGTIIVTIAAKILFEIIERPLTDVLLNQVKNFMSAPSVEQTPAYEATVSVDTK